MRPSLEVADIFRAAGPTYRAAHAGHLSLFQLKVMTAIENCRTAALGGHVEACEDCGHWPIAYNSCRNRHCPKCQAPAARTWLAERDASGRAPLLPASPRAGPKEALGVYAKPPFAGPEAVLAYLSRYTHRVAISDPRLIAFDETGVTMRYKDYRRADPERQQVMTIGADEFIRRFLLHVLPRGFHRIRHYGLLAASSRKANLALARQLLDVAPPPDDPLDESDDHRPPCPCCGGHMVIIETFERWRQPRAPPPSAMPIREFAS